MGRDTSVPASSMATQVLIRCLRWSIVRCTRDVSNAPSHELIGDHVGSHVVPLAGINTVVDHRTRPR